MQAEHADLARRAALHIPEELSRLRQMTVELSTFKVAVSRCPCRSSACCACKGTILDQPACICTARKMQLHVFPADGQICMFA